MDEGHFITRKDARSRGLTIQMWLAPMLNLSTEAAAAIVYAAQPTQLQYETYFDLHR